MTPLPPAATFPAPLPLCQPAVDPAAAEALCEQRAYALEQALRPLVLYCAQHAGHAALAPDAAPQVPLILGALDAAAAYVDQVDALLRLHRHNVSGLNRQLHAALAAGGPVAPPTRVHALLHRLLAERANWSAAKRAATARVTAAHLAPAAAPTH